MTEAGVEGNRLLSPGTGDIHVVDLMGLLVGSAGYAYLEEHRKLVISLENVGSALGPTHSVLLCGTS